MQNRTISKKSSATCLSPECPQPNDGFTVSYEIEEVYDPATKTITVGVKAIRDAGTQGPFLPPTGRSAVITRYCPWCKTDRPVRVEY
ncbi:MAG TPA: hypothetical protein VD886_10235 [Herpetosiphonaceae bacterium]|nr:hypothetical protein [Herpetosiphonaceae bacterium]